MGLEEDFIKKIQVLEKGVLQNKKNANNIVKLMKLLDVKGEAVVFLVVRSLQRVFAHFINKGELVKTYDPSEVASMYKPAVWAREAANDDEESVEPTKKKAKTESTKENGNGKESAEEVFSKWILTLYNRYIDKLLMMMGHQQEGIQKNALEALFGFVKLESKMQSSSLSLDEPVLQPHLLIRILTQIITPTESTEFLLTLFCTTKLKIFHDIQYLTYWILGHSSVLTHKSKGVYPHEAAVYKILSFRHKTRKFWMKTTDTDEDNAEEEEAEGEGETGNGEKEEKKVSSKVLKQRAAKLQYIDGYSIRKEVAIKQRFSEAWMKFLTLELSKGMLKQILTHMDTILPLLADAFVMMDFLNKCYALGGMFSILALNGIFIQITKFNLDFPHFYRRLYALFDTGVLHTKNRGNFFKLASKFMFSKYLPTYTAAAFVKRIMRIALTAPPSGIMLALAFAYNVMQIHPSIQVLVHRTAMTGEGGKAPVLLINTSMGTDPYDAANPNPAQCSAINSSLWELLPFMNHQSPTVAKMAQAFQGPLDQMPYDFEALEDASYNTMFVAEINEPARVHPVNFVPKKSLFDANLGWALPK